MDIEEDWLEDSTFALEEDWKEEDEDWFIVEEDFIDEVLTDLLVWLKPQDSDDSSWKVASCLDSWWMELDWLASEKLMLPPFCCLVKILELVLSTSCACHQMWASLLLKNAGKIGFYCRQSLILLQAGECREGWEGVSVILLLTSILNSPEVRFLMAASRPMGITLTPPTRSFPLICKEWWLALLFHYVGWWRVELETRGLSGPGLSQRRDIILSSHTTVITTVVTASLYRANYHIFPLHVTTKYTNELELYTFLSS